MGAPLQAQRSGGSQRSQFADTTRRALERSLLYSEELGIGLAKRSDAEYFRWFLASLLFGARISETTAKNTYRSFIRHGLTNPQKILKAGWDFLVYPVMREGGYVRYDGRKSTQVLRDCEMLVADYGGRLSRLHDAARDARDVEERLLAFYGVGPVTSNIFLRELRPFWTKADPAPLPTVEKLAKRLSIDLNRYRRQSLVFARVEAGLIRRRLLLMEAAGPAVSGESALVFGSQNRRIPKCLNCPMSKASNVCSQGTHCARRSPGSW